MPKKPKYIEEKVDQLIKENRTSKEIIEIMNQENQKVSSSYISSRRKKLKSLKDERTPQPDTSLRLSKASTQLLYKLMGILGIENIDALIKTISDDYREIIKQKYRYDIDNEKTVAQVFREFEDSYKMINSLDKNETQIEILEKYYPKKQGPSEAGPITYYQVLSEHEGFKMNIFDFLAEYTVKYCNEVKKVYASSGYGYPFLNSKEEEPRD